MPTTTNDINKFIRHDGAFTCEAFERGGRVFVTLMNFDYDKCNTTTASGKSILCAGRLRRARGRTMRSTHGLWSPRRCSPRESRLRNPRASVGGGAAHSRADTARHAPCVAGPVMNVTYDVSMQNKHLTWTHFDQDSVSSRRHARAGLVAVV